MYYLQVDTSSEDQMKLIHHCLMELNVVTGNLVCTETGRKFPIQAGIPNMLLVQDEL
jgi:multifunctional methyltransferase subunit TRM112